MIQAAVVQNVQVLSVPLKSFLLLMRYIWPRLWQPCLALLHRLLVRIQFVAYVSAISQFNAMLRYQVFNDMAQQTQERLPLILRVVVGVHVAMLLPISAYLLLAVTQLAGF